jgi:hypothetical protein
MNAGAIWLTRARYSQRRCDGAEALLLAECKAEERQCGGTRHAGLLRVGCKPLDGVARYFEAAQG